MKSHLFIKDYLFSVNFFNLRYGSGQLCITGGDKGRKGGQKIRMTSFMDGPVAELTRNKYFEN